MNPPSAPTADPASPALRSDLTWHRQRGRRGGVIVADEVAGTFVRLSASAAAGVRRCDAAALRFAASAGLCRRRIDRGRRRWSPGGLLAIRLPICRGDRMAASLAAWSDPLFSMKAIYFWTLMGLLMATAMVVQFAELTASAAAVTATSSAGGGTVRIAVIVLVTKLVHELGHAVACRRAGAAVRSMGVMLFCGMPCPYCDVTDAWRLPARHRRAAVMAGGVYAEMILATIAAAVFLIVDDPAIRSAAAVMIVVCLIGSLLFNVNPLMRYDGYYVLADWVGSVDLGEDARRAANRLCAAWGGGHRSWRRLDRATMALSVYHVARKIYRVVVLGSMAAMAMLMSETIGLSRLTLAIVGVAVLLTAAVWIWRTVRGDGSHRNKRWIKIIVAALAVGALFVPLPRWSTVPGTLSASQTQMVVATIDGVCHDGPFGWGQPVAPETVVVRIDNDDLRLRRIELDGRIDQLTAQTQSNQRSMASGDDQTAAERYRSDREQLAMLRRQADLLADQIETGSLRATTAGWWIDDRFVAGSHPVQTVVDRSPRGQVVRTGQTLGRVVSGDIEMLIDWLPASSLEIAVGDRVWVTPPAWAADQDDAERFEIAAILPIEPGQGDPGRVRLVCRAVRPRPMTPRRLSLIDHRVTARVVHRRATIASRLAVWTRRHFMATAWR